LTSTERIKNIDNQNSKNEFLFKGALLHRMEKRDEDGRTNLGGLSGGKGGGNGGAGEMKERPYFCMLDEARDGHRPNS